MDLTGNPNTYWMSIFVEELVLSGLEAVCIAPGSRSTPLTLAFAANPGVKVYRHLDERSAGFFALGMAMATEKPVALVCTSGTAAANFHPAIIEAYYSHVPLLVLTADRPAELRGSGANQTIDQIKMFGDHVRWAVEVPTPETHPPAVVLRHMRTLAARSFAKTLGPVPGPVHLNFPFRKPLEPGISTNGREPTTMFPNDNRDEPYTIISRGRIMPDAKEIERLAADMIQNPKGLIICGPGCPRNEFPEAVARLAERTGYPVLADPLSNLRHGPHLTKEIIGGYHWWLPALGEFTNSPTMILRFGAVPTSSALAAYLDRSAPLTHYHISEHGEWADDLHLTHHLIHAEPAALCTELCERLSTTRFAPDETWASRFMALEADTWRLVGEKLAQGPLFDGAAVAQVLNTVTGGMVVFAGNSMAVRHVDSFDQPSTTIRTFFGNRGASGIDGNVSTALGIAAATDQPTVAILGDITFYHDMNGLLAVRQHGLHNITFIVLNNDGGSIFHRLPVAQHDPPFTDLFLTPHGLTYEHAAAMYGLEYSAVGTPDDLVRQLDETKARPGKARLIEVFTDNLEDFQCMQALAQHVKAATASGRSLPG